MATFEYAAIGAAGTVTGRASASDELALDRDLESKGLTLTRAKELRDGPVRGGVKLSRAELVFFTTQLSTLLEAGVPVVEGLRGIGKRMRTPSGKRMVDVILENLEAGHGLAETLAAQPRSFPHVYTQCVAAGELSGSLPKVLTRLASFLSWVRAMRTTTIQALVYPAILMVAILVLIIVLLTFVIPRITSLFPGGEAQLPYQTRLVMSISDFLTAHWLLLLGGVTATVVGYVLARRAREFRIFVAQTQLKIPRYGEVARMLATSRFAATASTLQGAGCGISTVLEVAGSTCGNEYLASRFQAVSERVRTGSTITESLELESVMDPLLIQMTHIGETAGDLAGSLERLSDYYDEEVPRTVKWFLSLLEPTILIVAGILVAFILLAALLPVFSLYESLA